MSTRRPPLIAFGPEAPEFGSWEWVGADIARALQGPFETVTFRDAVPVCDVVVFVKFKPLASILRELSQRCRIVYAPIDIYGSASEIDADGESLRQCDGIVAHCERLLHYCTTYADTTYIDHHLKFIAPLPVTRPSAGPILWVGNHSNLPPLIEWLRSHTLPEELWVLTDREDVLREEFPANQPMRMEHWSPERHIEWTALARGAIDIKGDDFRARHKPPTKALDYVASGLPLAMNAETSSGEYLHKHCGLSLPDPAAVEQWLSDEYWRHTQSVAKELRQRLPLSEIARRWHDMLRQLLPAAAPMT